MLAMILQRQGRNVLVIDKGTHPRLAIGESSTPTANMVLASLARRYDLPRLAPLARYGTWKTAYPHLACGLKRGFSYFKQVPQTRFAARDNHANALLVTANRSDQVSDTQWFRSDVDAFLAAEVQSNGSRLWEGVTIDRIRRQGIPGQDRPVWRLTGRRDGHSIEVTATFVVDATGAAGIMPQTLGIGRKDDMCRTNSRALFGHFRDVDSWHEVLVARGCQTASHPFPCDHAAQHQMLDEGWMWLLRFENGVTSAGLVMDANRSRLDPRNAPELQWQQTLARYPDLDDLFRHATLVDPPASLVRTARLQRRWRQIVGEDWAALPHTAGFIDPLHSTGIAHSLCGVERLATVLEHHWQRPSLPTSLESYQQTVQNELDFVDQLVSACYVGLNRFPLLIACSMLYFAAATTYEERRAAGVADLEFLCAHDQQLRAIVTHLTDRLQRVHSEAEVRAFCDELAAAIRPFNSVGLCDPSVDNMYHYTAAPEV